jgi:hypothetical protein
LEKAGGAPSNAASVLAAVRLVGRHDGAGEIPVKLYGRQDALGAAGDVKEGSKNPDKAGR